MVETIREFMAQLAHAAIDAPDLNPPHMHVDEFLPVDQWTDAQIILLVQAVKTIQVMHKCPIVAIEDISFPQHAAVPDSIVAIGNAWRAVQETPPAIYVMDEGDVPPWNGLLLPTATREFSERCGPVAVYLNPRFMEGEGYHWQIVLDCGHPELGG